MSTTCAKCTLTIEKDQDYILCDCCRATFHNIRSCTVMTATEIFAMEIQRRALMFFCNECRDIFKQTPLLLKKISSLEKNVTMLNTKVEELKTNQGDMNYTINSLREELERFKNVSSRTPVDSFKVEEVLKENNDRQMRSKNIMIFNLPLSQISDTDEVKKLVKDLTNTDLNIKKVIRVGKENKNGNRAVKVVFSSDLEARTVIRARKDILKDRKIYINADLTPLQASYIKKLRQDLEKRRSQGEVDIAMRYINGVPQIVKQIGKK